MAELRAMTDEELFKQLKESSRPAFDEVYTRYWKKLYAYAYHNLQDKEQALEIVHDIFVMLWERRDVMALQVSLSGYLFAAVRYQIIRYIKNSQRKREYLSDYLRFTPGEDNSTEEAIHLRDLEKMIEDSLTQLPPRCQEIFRLSRQQHKSIREIATLLNISHRTVENQLTYALKHLRGALGEALFFCATLFYIW